MEGLAFFARRTGIMAASAAFLVGGLLCGATALAQSQQQTPSVTPPMGSSGSSMGSGASGSQMGQQTSPAISMDSDEIRKVQQALKDKGHDISIDGIWGPNTQQALRSFQQEQGIEGTGDLNQETIQALGVDVQMDSGSGASSSGGMGSSGSMGSGSTGGTGATGSGTGSMGSGSSGSMGSGSTGSMGSGSSGSGQRTTP